MLGGWLHHDTVYVASTAVRCERRRQNRERQAVEMNAQAIASWPSRGGGGLRPQKQGRDSRSVIASPADRLPRGAGKGALTSGLAVATG